MSKRPYIRQYTNTNNIEIVPTMCFWGDPPSKKQKSENSDANYKPEACSNQQTCKKTIGTDQETKNNTCPNSVTDLNKKNLSNSSVEVNINKKGCMETLPKKDECDFVMHELKETKKDFSLNGSSWASSFLRSISQPYDKPKRLTLSSKKKKDHLSETAVSFDPRRICQMNTTTSVQEFAKKVTPNSEDTNKVKSNGDIRTLTNKPLVRNKTKFDDENSSKPKNKNKVNMGVGVIHKITSKESSKPLSHTNHSKIIKIEKRGKSAFKNENDLSFNIRDVDNEMDVSQNKIKITDNSLKCSTTSLIDKQKLVKRTKSSTCLEDKTSKNSSKYYQVIEKNYKKNNTNNCANKITCKPPTKILSKIDKGSKEKQLYDLHNKHTSNIKALESSKSFTQIPDSSKFNKNGIISFSNLKIETSKPTKLCGPESQHISNKDSCKSERKTKIKSDRNASPAKKHRGFKTKDKVDDNLHETNQLLIKKNEGKVSEKNEVNAETLSKSKSGSQIIDKENKISKSKATIKSDKLKSIIKKLFRTEKINSKTNKDNISERKSSPPVKRIDNLHETKQLLLKKNGGKVSEKNEINVVTLSKLGSGKSESQKNTDKENKISKSKATIKTAKLKSIIKNPHGSEKIKSKTINDSLICEKISSHPVKTLKQEPKNFEHLEKPLRKPKIDTYFDLRTKLSCRNLSTLIAKIRNEKYVKSTNKVQREERENLIITVENDNTDKNIQFEKDILLKDKNIKLQDEYMKPRIKKQKKSSKAQRCKKIKLVINVKTRKRLASSSEDDASIKKDKVIPEKNPDLSFLDDFNIDEIVNSLDNNVKELDVCESNVFNLENSNLHGTDVFTPDATEDYENIYNIQQHINNFNKEKMDVCESENKIMKSQQNLHFRAQRSLVQEMPIKVLDDTTTNGKKGADASNTGASYLKALLGDLDSQSKNYEAPLDKLTPVTSQVSHVNKLVSLLECKNSKATLDKLDSRATQVSEVNELVSLFESESGKATQLGPALQVSQADDLTSLFEYDNRKASLNKLVSQDSKVGELASPFKCENSKPTLDKLEPILSQADELVSQADELVSLFRSETDKTTFNKFDPKASQVAQSDKYMERLPFAYIDLTDETDIVIKVVKKEIEPIEITEDEAEKKTNSAESTKLVQAVGSDSNKDAKTNSVTVKHEKDIPKTPVDSTVNNALDFPCKTDEQKIKDDKEIEEKVCSKIFQMSNMNEVDKLIAKQLENRMIEHLNEKYSITYIIKSGQYSKIYRCQDSRGIDRALKLMNNKMYSNENQRMLMSIQEDIPTDNLKCVYIINSFAFLGKKCFLMEYYPKNLAEALMENMGPFHINVVQDLSRQLVTAVMVLRNNNIVHTDIKPSHILLNSANDSLKLCGFDTAFAIDCVELLPSLGTINYRAPEVILCYSADYGIDVWSTALVMYEMATNIQLFPGIYNNDVLFKQMCTLGNIPYDMLRDSWCKNQHFVGTSFKRILGPNPLNYVLKDNFFKSNRLRNSIYHAYRLTGSQNKVQRNRDLTKVDDFYTLLEQMLTLHPKERLAIEYVYAHPFILQ